MTLLAKVSRLIKAFGEALDFDGDPEDAPEDAPEDDPEDDMI